MEWPPELDELKDDMGVTDDRDDAALQRMLDASVSFVRRVRPEFNYVDDPLSPFPAPTADLRLGVLRLAWRWHIRRRSPDALVAMGEMGVGRVPSFDPDIERLLGIGRFAPARFA